MAVLDERAKEQPDQVAYTFLRDGEVEQGNLTFRQLRDRATAVAARLTSLNAPGDRAILLYPQGLEFIVAFFGCLYAGVIAVPASIPNRKRGFEILRGVAADAGAKWILAPGSVLLQFADDFATDGVLSGLSRLDPEERLNGSAPWTRPPIAPSDLVLLQYTSGSTGSPRGVAVTHGNLVDNHEQIHRALGHDKSTVVLSWLPMFHDMGLGLLLMPIWSGARCVLMSPGAFVQKPRRWLAAISKYRATTSWAPDFAYDLCARRLGEEERSGLDLSSWRVAGNGSEPVRASTIDRFVEAFAHTGFRRESVYPGYGLAENTLFATGGEMGEAPLIRHFSASALEQGRAEPPDGSSRGYPLVSCGHPWLGTRLAIVNPETHEELGPGQIGEVWLSGASVAAGYWGKEVITEQIFRATTSEGKGPFLRTGDLGFIQDSNLFVTGRHKDLIIIRGRNHYPQDIESSVSSCHPALVAHGCAAFSIDSDQGEQLVIIQEVERVALRTLDAAAIFRAIRAVVSDRHALHTHAVILLKPSTLPRTTSGKVRRKACRDAFLDRSLPAVASWTAPITPATDADAHPDTERREASARADRLIDWLRRHAADLISAYANDERRVVPAALLRDLGKQGLFGMQVEPRYGGLGLGHSETARVLEQLAAFDFGLALFVGLNNYLGIQPVAKYARSAIKAVLLPGLAHGEELAAFAFEEPGSGPPPRGIAVTARPDGEERWQLYGTKYLDGVVQGATVINVFAQHEEPPGISAFVVSHGVEGLRHVREGLSIGVLGFTRGTIALEGVRIGRENLLGSLGSGLDIAREAMMQTRLAIAAACVGGMKRCAQLVTRDGPYYGAINGNFTPNPVTLSRLGSIAARVTALECLVQRIAAAIDSGRAVPSEAFAACKVLGPELLLRSIDDLMQLGVSGGYAETDRISGLYRDAGLLRNFDGPPEAVAELTGAVIMEGDASLRVLVEEVFQAPEVVRRIAPAIETVRQRMTTLSGALARRAQRWGHTRAGELAMWLALLAAVDGRRRSASEGEIERAHAWAEAQFEHALASVRFGTPSETAALDSSDIAATLAAYSRSIGGIDVSLAEHPVLPVIGSAEEPSPASQSSAQQPRWASEFSRRDLRSWIISWLARRLQIQVSQIESGRSFADHGLDSVAAVELAKALSDKIGRELDATLLWNFATIDELVEHLVRSTREGEPAATSGAATVDPAAPVGVAGGPNPGAQTVESELDDEITQLEKELRSRS